MDDTGFLVFTVITVASVFIAVWVYLELSTRVRQLTEENQLLRLMLRRDQGAPR